MKKKRLIVALAAMLVVAGCGLFDRKPKEFEPRGTPFTLKPTVPLLRVTGAAPYTNFNGWTTLGFEVRGDTAPWVETLPAGLFFLAKSKEVQNIILLKRHIIRGVPYDTVLPIGGFCINPTRGVPGAGDTFELGPVTDHAEMRRLITAVADKDIRCVALGWLQLAVWEVVEDGKLADHWLDSISRLPPDTGGPAPAGLPLQPAGKFRRGRMR